ncbi:hypothetical protein PSEWESI4_02786 [Pseudomonas carbonaria]|uniref:Uncharacterized protein n=1 Tax=Zestomonas carbonaria TaxID=2762745 RepID=A0A7U7EP03_9GAMM|nr:hypothetical protein PSEWESI4_02786 [Pseudomonas carbonaria]
MRAMGGIAPTLLIGSPRARGMTLGCRRSSSRVDVASHIHRPSPWKTLRGFPPYERNFDASL